MKVLLINPSQHNTYGFKMNPAYPPMGLLYIASVLEDEGCQVRFVDIDADGLNLQNFYNLFNEFNPAIVGLTALTPAFNNALSVARIVKDTHRNIRVVFGGIHATIAPADVIHNKYIDFVIEGEGEIPIRELIRQLDSGRPDYTKVPGLWYKQDGDILKNPRPALINELDSIPFPARHLIENPKRYLSQDAIRMPVATIITSRGCPGRCTFCQTKQIFGKVFRYRSVENIIAEIGILINRFKVKEIHIMDDVFTLRKERVLKLCDEIKKREYDVSFQIANGLRADMVDEEILRALKSIGLMNVGFGVETGSELIMKNIKKDEITKSKLREAFNIAKRLGFETWGFFILGLPGETKLTANETINFAKELDPNFAKFLILKPFPGSEIFEELNVKGLIFNHNYNNYGVYTAPVHRLETMSEDEILYWQKKAFREFYFRPKKLAGLIFRRWTFTRIKICLNGLRLILKTTF